MAEIILRFLAGFLLDRSTMNDLDKMYNWHLKVGACLMVTTVVSVMWVFLSLGLMPWMFPGFARSGELTIAQASMDGKLDAIRVKLEQQSNDDREYRLRSLTQNIIDTKIKACHAPPGDLRDKLSANVVEMQRLYHEWSHNGEDFIPPICADL